MTTDALKQDFRNRFSREAEHIFFCPGRVNLIGEHIDYNGGKVLPCAIAQGTYLAVAKNKDKMLRFQCLHFPETASLHLQSSYSKTGSEWFNYPLGVIDQVLQAGHTLSGLDMLFYGDLPIGAGLSSSASIEVLMAVALNKLFALGIAGTDIAVLSKEAENKFIGVNCGIMDQFAVAMGKKDQAILLDCDTLQYEYIPFNSGAYALLIVNTNKRRTLADSKYNERFAECGAALKLLKQELKEASHLCDIAPASFEMYMDRISNPVLERRSRHVISENQRVKDTVQALKNGDIRAVGKLLYASHDSLRDDYEVSGKELDTIVDFCRGYRDCIGARMTGAGFGGCAIALVQEKSVDDFSNRLSEYYREKIGYTPEVISAVIADGAGELTAN